MNDLYQQFLYIEQKQIEQESEIGKLILKKDIKNFINLKSKKFCAKLNF